jgi:predicted unusual protein kinase regulating ubiquinone biosynthesis (AarF/ABC1/UbiB family)
VLDSLQTPREAKYSAEPDQNGHGVRVLLDETAPQPPVAPARVVAIEEVEEIPPPPTLKPRPQADVPPHLRYSSGSRRSLRMQIRYTRTLLWATRLLLRILFWEWIVKRIRGEAFVRQHNIARWKQYAREFRDFAARLGGVFIKAGQFISTRADIFPEEIIMELAGLQDEIPSIPFADVERVLKEELGDDYQKHFRWLNIEPIAAASLGQVHRGQLKNGDRVVMKVQRPGIISIIETDMAALLVVSRVANRFKFISKRVNAVEVTEEFGRVLWEEVSYVHEAENALAFARIFRNDLGVYIPTVYEAYSSDRVLMLEDVTSIKLSDYDRMEAAGIKRSEVARRLMNSYLRQVFDERYFHADPHPGNIFIYPLPYDESKPLPPEGRPFYLIYIDFGMTGKLTQQIVDGMVNTLIAVVSRDAKRLIQSYAELDLLLPGANLERLEQATKAAFDQVWGMDMSELRDVDYSVMQELGNEFNDLMFDMPFKMPQNFIYLARTMGILSGICTSLDPKFNVWQELQPYTEKMMRLRASDGNTVGASLLGGLFGVGGASNIFEAGSQVISRALGTNTTANNELLMQQLRSGEVRVTSDPSRKWEIQMHFMHVQLRIIMRAVLFAAFLISSTLLFVNGYTWVGAGGFAVCAAIGWRIIFPPNLFDA